MFIENSNNRLEIARLSSAQKVSLMLARCELDDLKANGHSTPSIWALRGLMAGLCLAVLIEALAPTFPVVTSAACGFGSSAIITVVVYLWEAAERRRIGVLSSILERFD